LQGRLGSLLKLAILLHSASNFVDSSIDAKSTSHSLTTIGQQKPTFYEQVTGVKVLFFAFSFIGLLLLVSLLSTVFLFALWMSCLEASSVPVGIQEESLTCPRIPHG
jgi:hypothetical protein